MNENSNLMQNSHELFRETVERCHKRNLDQWISNSATPHAALLLCKLLDVARKRKERVRIISGKLDRRVYDQLVGSLKACEKAGVEMDVVVLDGVDDEEHNDFYRRLRAYENARCYTLANSGKEVKVPHMMVVGNTSLRYEIDTKSHEAQANFNNRTISEMLIEIFDNLVGGGGVTEMAAA